MRTLSASTKCVAMRHTSLTAFLNDELPAEALWHEIEVEVRECLASCAKHGSGSINFTGGPDAPLTRKQMNVLVAALADGKVPLEGASYIADAIIMSHCFDFEDDAVGDAVHLLPDDSPPLTMAKVEVARVRLAAPD